MNALLSRFSPRELSNLLIAISLLLVVAVGAVWFVFNFVTPGAWLMDQVEAVVGAVLRWVEAGFGWASDNISKAWGWVS